MNGTMNGSKPRPYRSVKLGHGSSNRGLKRWYTLVGCVTLFLGVLLFYVYLFALVTKNGVPPVVDSFLGSFRELYSRVLGRPVAPPTPIATAHDCDLDHYNLDDPACLNIVGEHPPPIVPSHFAAVHGIEPFERANMKPWDLHTIPTDEWYDRAKIATDQCELELTYETRGAKNGLDDKVWPQRVCFMTQRNGLVGMVWPQSGELAVRVHVLHGAAN